MALIVKKFGGSSLRDFSAIETAAKQIRQSHAEGNQVLVVVSAQEGQTNALLKKAGYFTEEMASPAVDLLVATGEQESVALMCLALEKLGISAAPRTGSEIGIVTTNAPQNAHILEVKGGDLRELLEKNVVPVVAGFQGISIHGDVTTLGRGGSDLTAIALAAALKADRCEIYTDVEGVYTADPRHFLDAKRIESLSFEEMMEIAASGAKVVQARAAELAAKEDIAFEIKSTFNPRPTTLVHNKPTALEGPMVRTISVETNKVLLEFEATGGSVVAQMATLTDHLALMNLPYELAVSGQRIQVIVEKGNAKHLEKFLPKSKEEALHWVTITGQGFTNHGNVVLRVVSTLESLKIEPINLATGASKIVLGVPKEASGRLAQALHTCLVSERALTPAF